MNRRIDMFALLEKATSGDKEALYELLDAVGMMLTTLGERVDCLEE